MLPQFLYPPDLIPIIKERWNKFQNHWASPASWHLVASSGKAKRQRRNRPFPPFPTDNELLSLLGVTFHVSLLREETRHTAVRVMYLPPTANKKKETFSIGKPEPFRLHPPIAFTVSNVLRLAPALQAIESAICIAPGDALGIEPKESLFVWGILHLGLDWWELMSAAEDAAACPPNLLTVTAFAPGSLAISTLGSVLVRIRNGTPVRTPLPDLDEGYVGEFLSDAADSLYNATVSVLNKRSYSTESDFDAHPRQLYFRTLRRIVQLIREEGHGATVLVLPQSYSASDIRLADRLNVKYQIEMGDVWKPLINSAVAKYHYFRLLFPRKKSLNSLRDSPRASAKALKELAHWEARLKFAREHIADSCRFIARLAAVDGAVVITKQMNLIGFGVEITAASPSLRIIKQALDPWAKDSADVSVTAFGTRHRSAMRMCSSLEECLAIVISQDGPIRIIKRVGADVVSWNDVALGRHTL